MIDDRLPSHLHAVSVSEALGVLDFTDAGLSEHEAALRIDTYDANRLPEPERPGLLQRVLSHFQDVPIYNLLAAAVLKAILRLISGYWRPPIFRWTRRR